MTGLDIFAWIVLIILILALLVGFIVLAMLPGKIARQRNHPQSDAINVAGWVGALGAGIFWPLALIWAFTKQAGAEVKPSRDASPSDGQEARS
ncbi:MAG: DUF3302 domain-containing protein [Pseudomonadota bacterium]